MLTLTDEQAAYQLAVRSFLEAASPPSEVMRLMATEDGYDKATWQRACKELGLAGLALPESYGGSGGGASDLSVVFEELGRTLSGLPALATVGLAATAILRSGDDSAARRWLPPLVDGAMTATLAWPTASESLVADRAGDAYAISGEVELVVDGNSADLLLVAAQTGGRLSLLAIEPGTPDVARQPLPTLDLTRKFTKIAFNRSRASLIGTVGAGTEILAHTLNMACVQLAAEQLGGAQRCLDMAVEYATLRYQFGRPIGSYQAVKHRCADAYVACELIRTAVRHATWIADHEPARLPEVAALVQAAASDRFLDVAASNMQVHGGIGFTWEHSAHLFLKRAKAMQIFLGDSGQHRRVLAQVLGL